MKVLWITNVLLPEAIELITNKKGGKGSGGWLSSSAEGLLDSGNINITLISASPLVSKFSYFVGTRMDYFVMPMHGLNNSNPYRRYMKKVNALVKPELVHVHGTEMPYGKAYIEECGKAHVIVSLQGMMNEISKHYTDGLTIWQIFSNITIRDLRLKTIFGEKTDYKIRVSNERYVLSNIDHVIGRTSFDKSISKSINPSINYHTCNESLREEFYNRKWTFEGCDKHRIFLSQANYPVKGLHQFLKALPEVRKRYPDVKIRIAGYDITMHSTLTDLIKFSGYGSIIYSIIKRYHLSDTVSFTGLLSASEMVNELLKSNLYVCPSSCENSSNSIAEAQILGVPCLASNRGGNPDMIPTPECGQLFDFENIGQLVDKITDIFDKSDSFDNSFVRSFAADRHNKLANVNRTLGIYNEILRAK